MTTVEPTLETGYVYSEESTIQLMPWGVVWDFMSNYASLYAKNHATKRMKIKDSRIQLAQDIAAYDLSAFRFGNPQHVFLDIAGRADGIPDNIDTRTIIVDSDDDSSYCKNESHHSDLKSGKDEIIEPPPVNRQCNRMSLFGQTNNAHAKVTNATQNE